MADDDDAEEGTVDDVSVGLSIESLPTEILELILRQVSPYEDLVNCRLVCKDWHKLVKDVVRWRRSGFVRDIRTMNVRWFRQPRGVGPSIFARYGHACCCHGDSMFVFGGCTGRNTTFNDLWRFDLNSRRWIRPLAFGTFPPPMAFSTFVSYEGILVLFGGLTYPSPSVLHQFQDYRLYNTLHFYEAQANQWLELTTISTRPPNVAGHSASVHGHLMVVFGGRQFVNGRHQSKCNDVWVLNLKTIVWWKQKTSEPKPPPMVNQTQVAIDGDHLLIIDGCGGPNMILSDMWLLRLEREPDVPWTWTKMAVHNQQHAAANLWYHPACKVEDKLVFLGRGPRSMSPVTTSMNQEILISPRVWIPPREEDMPLLRMLDDHRNGDPMQNGGNRRFEEENRRVEINEIEPCVNGVRGVLPVRNRLPLRSVDDSPASSSSSSSSPQRVPDAETAGCSSSPSESDKSRDDNCESRADGPILVCSMCGSPKLHSLKRRRMSSSKTLSTTVDAEDSLEDDVTTDWCHCTTTAAASSSASPKYEGSSQNDSMAAIQSSDAVVAVPMAASLLNSSRPSPMVVRNTAMPSVRPNALRNRVRQMELFQRMEQRIRNMMRPAGVQPPPLPPPPLLGHQHPNIQNGNLPVKQNIAPSARQPMFVYVLDISGAVERGVLEWLPLRNQSTSDGPEDTAFYSLVKGRGEIVMFGGIQRDQQLRNQGPFCGRNVVSDHVYILSSKLQTF